MKPNSAPACEFNSTTHTYKRNGLVIPGVTTILRQAGFVDISWYTEAARWRGSNIHTACMFDDRGTLDEESDDGREALAPIQGYIDAWRLFKQQFCLNSDPIIIDLKSGVVQPWAALQMAGYIQLDPYSAALNSIMVQHQALIETPLYSHLYAGTPDRVFPRDKRLHLYRRLGVQVKATGKYTVREFKLAELASDTRVFQAAVACYHWQANHK